MDRVALFVDVQNVFYTVRASHGCHFDYRVFWERVTQGRKVVRAIAYAIDRQDPLAKAGLISLRVLTVRVSSFLGIYLTSF